MRKLTTVFAILLTAIVALADAGVGQLPSGGSAGIMGDDLGIRLAEETVVVGLEKDSDGFSFSVLADFTLRNSGSAQSVFLFLPVSSISYHTPELYAIMDGENPAKETDRYDVWLKLNDSKLRHQLFVVRRLYDKDDIIAPEGRIAFQTNDGEKYALWPISRATDEDLDVSPSDWWDIWAVCSVDIPAGDSTLRYHYDGVPALGFMLSFSDVYYPLWSGASWSGTIGAGMVTYVLGDGLTIDDTFGYSAPEDVEVEPLSNGYRFSFEDYEPQSRDEFSVKMVVNNRFIYFSSEGLRVAPSFDAAFANGVESFEEGNQYLFILDAQGAWIKGRTEYKGEEITGWLFDEGFDFNDGGTEGDLRMVWENPINFRTEPSSGAERVADYPTVNPYGYQGEWDYLQFIERKGDWLRIIVCVYDDGTTYHHGWARWRYLDPETGKENIYITK
ncbi:hypothetical protein K8R78_03935 [bacterium]|nr:hypothetical protein [bacterium]